MKRIVTSVIAFSAVTLAGTNALAQGRPEGRTWFEGRVAAPSSALELSVATGYTQGFGELRGNTNMNDVATNGIGFDLGVGYRLSPRWSLGVAGQYHELYAPHAHSARGMTTGIAATYHFDPESGLDPWLEVGTGYRLLWQQASAGPNVLTHGLQLARARAGLDFRIAPEVAIAPVVGADLNIFLWQDAGTSTAIADPRLNTFVFAGLAGRFDMGTMVGGAPLTAKRETAPLLPMSEEISTTTVTSAPIQQPTERVSESISVSDTIARACNLHFNDLAQAPRFEFDKSAVLPADDEVLGKIATCVTSGPLKGRSLMLVGRADPRGTQKYNMALGARRANSVAVFLEHLGVDPTQVRESSRGALDATGKDEATWIVDRRVDVLLAE
jgi:peptidoglycan-associated lipoprotein